MSVKLPDDPVTTPSGKTFNLPAGYWGVASPGPNGDITSVITTSLIKATAIDNGVTIIP